MPKIKFEHKVFRRSSIEMIDKALVILDDYEKMGFKLTLRQLYYQFIIRKQFPDNKRYRWTGSKWVRDINGTTNAQPNYKWLGTLISDARLAGIIDWDAIEDRVRNLQTFSSWESPEQIVQSAAQSFRLDLWENQPHYIEVWVEKDALIGVLSRPCSKWRVRHIACKGYMSLSEVWDCGWNRLKEKKREGKIVTVIHLGDHDPSGVDMTRDITERISLFAGGPINIRRIALNIDQVEHYEIPPDPAKSTDSRFKGYVEQFGEDSWELDALTPNVIADLIEKEIVERVDMAVWEKDISKEQVDRNTMAEISERFDGIQEWIAKSNMEGWQFE